MQTVCYFACHQLYSILLFYLSAFCLCTHFVNHTTIRKVCRTLRWAITTHSYVDEITTPHQLLPLLIGCPGSHMDCLYAGCSRHCMNYLLVFIRARWNTLFLSKRRCIYFTLMIYTIKVFSFSSARFTCHDFHVPTLGGTLPSCV